MNSSPNPTVLIHGYGFDHRIWYPVELAFEGHHVIYLSLPGFGLDQVTDKYTIPELANKYWRHLNDIVQEPLHLVGHSMGGYVCMEMIAQQPSRVASLALIHSHVFEDSNEKRHARSETMQDISTNGREAFVKKLIPSLFGNKDDHPEIINMLIERGMVYDDNAWCFGTLAMRERRDHAETLKNIKVPVLVVAGENDKSVTIDMAHRQSRLSDMVTMHTYPGVGHLAMYESTARMIQDLIRFYDSVST